MKQYHSSSDLIKKRLNQFEKAEMSSTTKIGNGISVNGRLKKQDTFQSNSSTTINLSKFDSSYHSSFQCRIYDKSNARTSKLFRILTVLAYIIAVSMAAILLSLYYTFIWNPYHHHHHHHGNGKEVTLIDKQHHQSATMNNNILAIQSSTFKSSNQTHQFIFEHNNKTVPDINSDKSRPIAIASLMMANQTENVGQ
uniref:Uncharacterized protein LOC113793385 n=1 Tax=Dermatophagoides pteronyssinus TaxID=6956 RepID=A0A6P6Y0Z1_DERPT|nr:uncharacterized protein LOC113793385 [Dermatophagoides pteronyssinus]